jgi:capsular polysaccharide biosynthesis protein
MGRMQQRSDIAYYIEVFRRRKIHFIASVAVVFLMAVLLAVFCTPVYKSAVNILVAFVVALGVGGAVVIVLEVLDRSIRRPEQLSKIIKLPILASVPYWETSAEAKAIEHRKFLSLLVILAFVVLGIVMIHFLYMPLDVIAVEFVRKIVSNF